MLNSYKKNYSLFLYIFHFSSPLGSVSHQLNKGDDNNAVLKVILIILQC